MTDDEQRQILESIARDESAYARDRIAAIKALRDLDIPQEEVDRLDRLVAVK